MKEPEVFKILKNNLPTKEMVVGKEFSIKDTQQDIKGIITDYFQTYEDIIYLILLTEKGNKEHISLFSDGRGTNIANMEIA